MNAEANGSAREYMVLSCLLLDPWDPADLTHDHLGYVGPPLTPWDPLGLPPTPWDL